jgi:hypothetical protein
MGYDRYVPGYRRRAIEGLQAPLRHDVLHFHFNHTFCEYVDTAWGRIAGKPLMLMHFHGDDCRRRGVTLAHHPARARIYDATKRNERLTLRRTRLAGRFCDAAIVADLELLEHVRPFFSTVYVVPAPVTIPDQPPAPTAGSDKDPVVLHAPSDSVVKGTSVIVEAIDRVSAHCRLHRRLVSGISQTDLLAEVARADIVVDQMNSETPGIFALQAMALGKPVLSEYRREMLAAFAQSIPIVQADPSTLADRLETLCLDRDLRVSLGTKGARYVRDVHDASRVAAAIERVYLLAPTSPPGVYEVTAQGPLQVACSPT